MSNKYSDEGTIAHALAAMCLTEGTDAAAYIGRVLEAEDYEHAGLSPSGAHRWIPCPGSHALESREPFEERKFSQEIDEDMARDVQVYVDNIRRFVAGDGVIADILHVEQSVPVDHITGEEGATGTADAVILFPDEIQMHDLKFGKGKLVSPDNNYQLQLYASGTVRKFLVLEDLDPASVIRLVIHQPRIVEAPMEWTTTWGELKTFEVLAKAAARQATAVRVQGVPLALDGHGGYMYLKPGDEQCKFCSVKATCPALAAKVQEAVGLEFEDLTSVDQPGIAADILPRDIDHELLGTKFAATDLIEMWVTAVRSKVESELLRVGNDPDVCFALGSKLVLGRAGNRKWTDEQAVKDYLKKSARLKDDVMYKFTLITPTKAEELFMPKKGVKNPKRWETLLQHIARSDPKPSVALLSDPRPAMEIKGVEEQFDDVTPDANEDLA